MRCFMEIVVSCLAHGRASVDLAVRTPLITSLQCPPHYKYHTLWEVRAFSKAGFHFNKIGMPCIFGMARSSCTFDFTCPAGYTSLRAAKVYGGIPWRHYPHCLHLNLLWGHFLIGLVWGPPEGWMGQDWVIWGRCSRHSCLQSVSLWEEAFSASVNPDVISKGCLSQVRVGASLLSFFWLHPLSSLLQRELWFPKV